MEYGQILAIIFIYAPDNYTTEKIEEIAKNEYEDFLKIYNKIGTDYENIFNEYLAILENEAKDQIIYSL